jgi:hypothetical protein
MRCRTSAEIPGPVLVTAVKILAPLWEKLGRKADTMPTDADGWRKMLEELGPKLPG